MAQKVSRGPLPCQLLVAYLRLKVFEQNLQLYGLSPESKIAEESDHFPALAAWEGFFDGQ